MKKSKHERGESVFLSYTEAEELLKKQKMERIKFSFENIEESERKNVKIKKEEIEKLFEFYRLKGKIDEIAAIIPESELVELMSFLHSLKLDGTEPSELQQIIDKVSEIERKFGL